MMGKRAEFKNLFLDIVIEEKQENRQGKVKFSYLRNDPSITLYLSYDLIDEKFTPSYPHRWIIEQFVKKSEGRYSVEDIERMAQESLQDVLFCEAKVEEYSKDDSVIGRTNVG